MNRTASSASTFSRGLRSTPRIVTPANCARNKPVRLDAAAPGCVSRQVIRRHSEYGLLAGDRRAGSRATVIGGLPLLAVKCV